MQEKLSCDYFCEVGLILQLFHKQNISGVGEWKEEYNFLLLLPVHKIRLFSSTDYYQQCSALATSDHTHGSTPFDWEEWLSGNHLQTVLAIGESSIQTCSEFTFRTKINVLGFYTKLLIQMYMYLKCMLCNNIMPLLGKWPKDLNTATVAAWRSPII